ncbi:MAG: division/cell wall cluster transcriptional repressor MraZ [Janthinobacterium lividum]
MSQFLGTHQTKLDAKNRTSVPAAFRAALRNGDAAAPAALVLRPSHQHACIEAWPAATFEALAAPLDQLDMFGDEHDDLSTALFADAFQMEADKDGRIILPEMLVQHAGLSETIVFLGKGRMFHIWEPEAARRYTTEARERARRLTIPGRPVAPKVVN